MTIVLQAQGNTNARAVGPHTIDLGASYDFLVDDVIVAVCTSDAGLLAYGALQYSTDDSSYSNTSPGLTSRITSNNSGNVQTEIGSAKLTSGITARYFRLNETTNQAKVIRILVFRGINSHDKASSGTGSSTDYSTGLTATLTSAPSLVVSSLSAEGPSTDTQGTITNTGGGLYTGTNSNGAAANVNQRSNYWTVATTTAVANGCTGATSRDWAAVVLTFTEAATGTQYNQSVSGAIANTALTGALARRPGKALSGAISNTNLAGAVNKFISRKNLAGTLTSAGTLAKRMYKALTGAINSAGTLATSKVTLRSFSGTLTSAGTVAKRTIKTSFVGVAGSAGHLAKRAAKSMDGAVTSAGNIIKQTQKFLDFPGWRMQGENIVYLFGSPEDFNFDGQVDVQKLVARLFTGALTSAGTVVKSTTKSFAGAVTSAGSIIKRTYKYLRNIDPFHYGIDRHLFGFPAGAGGVLTTLKTTLVSLSGQLWDPLVIPQVGYGTLKKMTTKAFSGVLTDAGAVVKRTAKSIAGAVNSSGALSQTRAFLRTLTGAMTSAGSVVKQTRKWLYKIGIWTPTGPERTVYVFGSPDGDTPYGAKVTVQLRAVRILTGSVTSAGAAVKRTTKSFAGAINSSGTLSQIRTFLRSVSGALTSSGTVLRKAIYSRYFTNNLLNPIGALSRRTSKVFVGAVTSSGALSALRQFVRAIAGTLTSAGSLAKRTGKGLSGAVTSAGSLSKRIYKSLSGILSDVGSLSSVKTATMILTNIFDYYRRKRGL